MVKSPMFLAVLRIARIPVACFGPKRSQRFRSVPSLAVPALCRERETMLALEVSAAVDQVFGIEAQQVTVLIKKNRESAWR